MNTPQNDGGRAFPMHERDDALRGMSLRDWFAGQALPGILSSSGSQLFRGGEIPLHEMVEYAYRLADAMLAERQQKARPMTPEGVAET